MSLEEIKRLGEVADNRHRLLTKKLRVLRRFTKVEGQGTVMLRDDEVEILLNHLEDKDDI